MGQHPSVRLVQMAVKSLGADPGPPDGWWGGETSKGVAVVLAGDRPQGTEWAFGALQRGLDGLGWYDGPISGKWSEGLREALVQALAANGKPRSTVILGGEPVLRQSSDLPVVSGGVIRQGSAGLIVEEIMLHTAATPGDWWVGKTNQEMFAEIRRWHTDPKSKGGRGWRDIGYHEVHFPNGEVISGRSLTQSGAGARGHNKGVVHLCMVPVKTIRTMGVPADFYTERCLASVRRSIARIGGQTPITRLSGHNEVAAKLCPGFVVNDGDWTSMAVS